MDSEQIIHVKLEYQEALESKRNILNSQAGVLSLKSVIQQYRKDRVLELRKKAQLQRKLKEFAKEINKINEHLPKVRIPKSLQMGFYDEIQHEIKKESGKKYDSSIESQLREIQEKLRSLKK